jgi:hypothetical protein
VYHYKFVASKLSTRPHRVRTSAKYWDLRQGLLNDHTTAVHLQSAGCWCDTTIACTKMCRRHARPIRIISDAQTGQLVGFAMSIDSSITMIDCNSVSRKIQNIYKHREQLLL